MKGRFADSLEPEFEKTKKELGDTAKCDEDVLSYIAFPQVATAFFKDREAGFPKKEEPKKAAPAAPKALRSSSRTFRRSTNCRAGIFSMCSRSPTGASPGTGGRCAFWA